MDLAAHRGGGFFIYGGPPPEFDGHDGAKLDRAGLVFAHCVVGRVAFFLTWLAIGGQPQPQYVDPHQLRHWVRLCVQLSRHLSAAGVSHFIYLYGARGCLF